MPKDTTSTNRSKELRKKAEESVVMHAAVLGELCAERSLHELQVHQMELMMQNEELHREQAALRGSEEQIHRNMMGLRGLVNVLQYRAETIQEFLDNALNEAIKLSESMLGYIYFYHEDKQQFVLNSWSKDVMKACSIITPLTCYELDKTGLWGEAVRQRKPILLNDFQADHPLKKGYPKGHAHLTRFLTLPIFRDERIIAVVGVANKADEYDETDLLQLTLLMDAVWKFVGIKEGEDALQASEARYRRITEGLTDYLYIVHIEHGRAVDTIQSPACEKVTGYTPEEFAANPYLWIEMVVPEDRDFVKDRVRQLLRGTEIPPIEHRIIRKNGEIRWVRDTTILFKDAFGNLLSYDGMIQDITEQKRAEEYLRELSQRLQLAALAARFGVWDWNVRANIMVWDDRMFELYGITRETFSGNIDSWMIGLHPDDRESAITSCHAALKGNREFDFIFRVCHPDGTVKHIKTNGLVIRGADGAAERMIGTNIDITDIKRAEEEKSAIERQFQQTQKLESLGVLAGGIGHDFNNILSVILGHCYLVGEDIDPGTGIAAHIDTIKKAAIRAADLCRQMLTYAGNNTLAKTHLNLWLTVDEIVKMLTSAIKKNVGIRLDLKHDVPEIHGDGSQIQQVIMNLIINAAEAIGDKNGTVTIALKKVTVAVDQPPADFFGAAIPAGNYACLTVSDNGCGMDDETQKRVFEPFYTTKFTGRGLGMSAVLGIIKSHGGALQMASTRGAGTTFTVYFPLPDANHNVTGTERCEPLPSRAARGSILLVDDEEGLRTIGSAILKTAGFSVRTAGNGLEALEMYREHGNTIDAVLLDLIMPVMGGLETYRVLREKSATVPIVICSGYSIEDILEGIENDQHFAVLQKPYNPVQLSNRLMELLESAEQRAQ